jgi:hypothetical protein
MALALKITLGAAALSSVFAVALTDRSQAPEPVAERDFVERYPVVLLPPSDAWRAQATPIVAATPIEAAPIVAVARTDVHQTVGTTVSVRRHASHRRISCRRQYYTVNKWRYWRCRR